MPADTGDPDGEGAPQGLSWSWELDLSALIDSLSDAALPGAVSSDDPSSGVPSCGAPGSDEEEAAQEAILDELQALDQSGGGKRIPMRALTGRVAERLAPGPDLTAWLAAAPAAGLDDRDLAAVAGSWRRVAAWAQAREGAASVLGWLSSIGIQIRVRVLLSASTLDRGHGTLPGGRAAWIARPPARPR